MNSGAGVMIPIAVCMSGALMATLWRVGAMQRGRRYWWLARLCVALFAYIAINIAYPLNESNPIIKAVALIGYGVVFVGVTWLIADRADAPAVARVGEKAKPYHLVYGFDWDKVDSEGGTDEEDGWIMEPASPVAGVAGAGVGIGMHDAQRDADSGGASENGSSEVRQPVSAGESGRSGSESSGGSGSSAGESGRTGGNGTGEQPGGNRQGGGGDQARDSMVVYPTVAPVNRNPVRRGRGRRLVGAMVPRTGAPGDGSGANANGYDAATAVAVSSINPPA